MFEIHEVTAAPHLPEALKSSIPPTRPESLFAILAEGFQSDTNVEVKLRNGEIFIAMADGY
ncbi:MAG: hypothetical protein JSR78_17215 [Proteobacteria bacterium]|nr:hypothetical protein [Pseudomonadota bacterium]